MGRECAFLSMAQMPMWILGREVSGSAIQGSCARAATHKMTGRAICGLHPCLGPHKGERWPLQHSIRPTHFGFSAGVEIVGIQARMTHHR